MGNYMSTTTVPATVPATVPTTVPATVPATTQPAALDLMLQTIDLQNNILTFGQNIPEQIFNTQMSTSTMFVPTTTRMPTNTKQQVSVSTAPFKNIENFTNNSLLSNPIILAQSNYPEIKNYIDSYNASIALLNDPNDINKTNFNTYLYIQNQKLENLKTNLDKLSDNSKYNSNKNNKPIKAFKSLNNSVILNTETYLDPTNSNNTREIRNGDDDVEYPNYLIYGNNGCLEYKPASEKPTTAASWNFQACNANNPNQIFYANQINNLKTYNEFIPDANNHINSFDNIKGGFYIVNPSTSKNQCLQLNNDGLTIMPCNLDVSQRFKPMLHNVL